MTPELLRAAVGCTQALADKFAEPLSTACAFYSIDTPERLAAFLAQIGHESASLRYTTEIWGPTEAQKTYEGRASLGNTVPGDGERFKGHGLIQTTGRFNHARVRDRLRERFPHLDVPDFEAHPEQLAEPQWACLSAADYWDDKHLNQLADAGDFETITRRINGGLNGQADRLQRWERAKSALSAQLQEKPVLPLLPIISAVLPSLVQAAPSLIRIFGDSPQAEKNAKAAEIVANIAKESTGETTTEGAANAIAADPEKAAAFREAVHVSMNDLLATLQAVNDIEQKNLTASRQFNAGEPMMVELSWLKLKFIHILSFVFVAYAGTFAMLKWDSLTAELKGAVITLMIIAGWNGVRDYWMSSSAGSAEKTRELVKSRDQQ